MSNWFSKLLGMSENDDHDDLIDAAAPTETPSSKQGKKKGPTPPVRPEIYYGVNMYLRPASTGASEETDADDGDEVNLWLPWDYKEKLKKEMGDDPTADPDDIIKTRVASGILEWAVHYVDYDGMPVRKAKVSEPLYKDMQNDIQAQEAKADAAYAAAKAEYQAKKSGKTDAKPATVEFELTDEILELVSIMDREEKLAFVTSLGDIKPLDRAKLLAARPKPNSPSDAAPAPASPNAPASSSVSSETPVPASDAPAPADSGDVASFQWA